MLEQVQGGDIMTGAKATGLVSFFSGSGTALAQIPAVPEDFGSWSVSAILGMITICSLGVTAYLIKKVFEAQSKHEEALARSAAQMGEASTAMRELNSRLDVRPCLVDRNKVCP